MNLRETILSAADMPLTPVEVPEWGVTVYLRPLSGADRSRLVKAVQCGGVLYGIALAASLADDGGKLLFTEADIDALNAKSGRVLERLSAEVVRLNGLGADAVDAAGNG